MGISMSVNDRDFAGKIEKRIKLLEQNVNRAVFKSTNLVKNDAVYSILRGAKTGVTSVRYKPRRTHQASAAGEAPASDTGFLASNITMEVSKNNFGAVGMVISSAPYSAALEFGSTKMAARPFLQPALDRSARKIKEIFIKEGLLD